MLTHGGLFEGIGGFSLAFEAAGFQSVWAVEKEPFCQQVLAKNFPRMQLHGDIFDCRNLSYVDVITAGFPCQPFSLAGKRQGDRDERYLVPEMLRVIDEVKPAVVLLENVPGFASLDDGRVFKLLLGALAEIGFDAEWGHLRASDAGAPHQRERWFCVAYADPQRRQESRAEQPPASDEEWNVPPHERGRGTVVYAALAGGKAVGNADGGRCEQRHAGKRSVSQFDTRCGVGRHTGSSRRAQSRMGRAADGLSAGLDRFAGFPAAPGYPQHDYEPPRVTSRTDSRAARLKALGNAVVPAVVLPLAEAIYEYLSEV